MKRNNFIPGLLLIGAGMLMFAGKLGVLDIGIGFLWPMFLIVPGLIFEFSFFTTGRNPGTLVPGGILTVYGLFFFFNILTKWTFMDSLWPIFILGPAIGLLQLYLFGNRARGVLIAASILGLISTVMLSFTLFGFAVDYIAPVLLILLGVLILTNGKGDGQRCCRSHKNSPHAPEEDLDSYYDMDDES
jgi:hypothetical protein